MVRRPCVPLMTSRAFVLKPDYFSRGPDGGQARTSKPLRWVGRLPTVGLFRLFLEQKGLADQFRFGREADGTPAAPWDWEDLGLWSPPRC